MKNPVPAPHRPIESNPATENRVALTFEEANSQSPVPSGYPADFWNEGLPNEELEGDLLRVTHTSKAPINVEHLNRKKIEDNTDTLASPSSNPIPQPSNYLSPQMRQSMQGRGIPRVTFGPLSTINEEESSINDTIRRSVNQFSVSDYSQRG